MARKFLVPINMSQQEIQNLRTQNLASAPSSPVVGQRYYDTTLGYERVYDGSDWWPASLINGLITSAHIANATIVNEDIAAGAAIALSKLATDPLARASHTGTQTASTISDFDTQVRTSRLDQMAAPTGSVALNSQKITGLANGTNPGDAVNRAQLDAVSSGLDVKASVRAGSTANVAGSYAATGGTSSRGQLTGMPNAVDGVTLAGSDRVLLKDQTAGAENGIWVVSTLGTGANGVWDRASDFDADAEVTAGAYTFVEEGTTNADSGWVLTTNNPITIGGGSGTALVWAQFSGAGSITGGAGLTKTGNSLDVGQGTGITVAADSVGIDTSVVVRKFAASVGDGSAVAYTVTHNLGTQDVTVAIYDNTTPFAEVLTDVEHTTTNTVIVRFAVAPTANQYRVVVHG